MSRLAVKMFYYQKYLGVFLVLIGTPLFFLAPSPQANFSLMIGFYILFTSMEKVEDERSLNIKMSSLYIAFIVAYAIQIILRVLHSWEVIPVKFTEIDHFIILVLALASTLHYARLYLPKNREK